MKKNWDLIALNAIGALSSAGAAILVGLGLGDATIDAGAWTFRQASWPFAAVAMSSFATALISQKLASRRKQPWPRWKTIGLWLLLTAAPFILLFRYPVAPSAQYVVAAPGGESDLSGRATYELSFDTSSSHEAPAGTQGSSGFLGSRRAIWLVIGKDPSVCWGRPDGCAPLECEIRRDWWLGGMEISHVMAIDPYTVRQHLSSLRCTNVSDAEAASRYDEEGMRYE